MNDTQNVEPQAYAWGQLSDFVTGYIEAALWSSTQDNEEPIDNDYGFCDMANETIKQMIEDCEAFQKAEAKDLAEFQEKTERPDDHCGHDFWLTRNGHGVGFWDRGAGDVGDRLSDAARVWRDAYLYIQDGQVFAE